MASAAQVYHREGQALVNAVIVQLSISKSPIMRVGNYVTTDQVLAVGGNPIPVGGSPQAQPSGRTPDASSCYGDDEQMTE